MSRMAANICRGVLIDLSGTLHVEDIAIPNAVEALERLRAAKKVCFVTNTTKESKKNLLQRLCSIGFKIENHEIFTSLTATRGVVEEKQLRPFLMLEDEALEDFEGITTENPNAVVIGLAPSKFNWQTMNKAFGLLLSGSSFIAVHKGRYYKKKDGLAIGPGAFVKALEYSSGVTAEVVGKPEPNFFLSGVKNMNCHPSEVMMIGDDVKDDIQGAQDCGIKGILVKTGKYKEGDEKTISPPPFHVCDSFVQAVDFILQHQNDNRDV